MECTAVQQFPDEPKKRWFFDHYFDLFIWESESSEIVAFQLCFEKKGVEKALSWSTDAGFKHLQVHNAGIKYGSHKMSPVMYSTEWFQLTPVKYTFLESSAEIDRQVKNFVIEKLVECESVSCREPAL
ncbi:MAG: hypothetical protein OEZ39_15645 [Gammaproteobacteria bacterium]|nr:hypothetical protein [Gammaproteobacteria bacterium]MDH5653290.1 hypothetical protein [Gammaproteobacteria bacterium]